MTPPSLLRRYLAWSADAALVCAVTLALARHPLAAALAGCSQAFDGLTTVMVSLMARLLDAGAPVQAMLAWLGSPELQAATTALASAITRLTLLAMAVFTAVAFVWFSAFEASPWQATPGKRWLGLKVTMRDGSRAALRSVALRNAAGLLSWLLLNIGHLMAARGPRYQALHDRLSGTRVVQSGSGGLPPAAWLWLWLQPAAACLLFALLVRELDARMAAAIAGAPGF